MKKTAPTLLILLLLASSCRSTEEGASTGASFGALIGSAIGGIVGGHRGHDIGTLVGIAAGGATGAVVGHRHEQTEQKKYESYETYESYESYETHESHHSPVQPRLPECPLTLHDLRVTEENGNRTINRGETCKVVFELANRSGATLYNVLPSLTEVNGNRHLSISAFSPIEQMSNGTVVRCTVIIKADKKLKAGTADLLLSVSVRGGDFLPLQDFSIPTGL